MKPLHFVLMMTCFSGCLNVAYARDMAKIEAGSYRPLYLKKDTPMIPVKAFELDKTAVTNAEFAKFVAANPEWQRGKVSERKAESKYLQQWEKRGNSFSPKAADANKPVTNVSWFAANAYCAAQGKRLPTIDEWEIVGQASATQKNGTAEPNFNRSILDWYASGGQRKLEDVGKGKPNFWGVHDMHGLIWEWTEDFNSSLLSSGVSSNLYCGSASVNSVDPSDYVAFMRYGIRTSLKPYFVLNNLGFRCAK
ncbi:formylglycine-generating enzyme family protein [Kingella negevensis]|nr:formylglycine-generating enzyme family protein [Kingella negevensis]WII93524.1 formylglycine-generating enzyme family protein [Kingella negevensis]